MTIYTAQNGTLPSFQPAWGLARDFSDRALDRVSAFDNLSQTERNDARSYTGSIDVTGKIQSIVNYLAGQQGGVIEVPPCRLSLNGLMLTSGVSLSAEIWHPNYRVFPNSGLNPYQIRSLLGPWAIDTSASVSYNSYVAGLAFSGPGASPSVGGVRFQNNTKCGVIGCSFNNFSEWAILHLLGNGCTFSYNLTQNCLLDRLRSIDQTTLPHGTIESRGSDCWFIGGEHSPSMGFYPSATFGAPVVTGTCQAGSGVGFQILAAGESPVDNFYAGYLIEITGGLGVGQMNYVTAYVGSTKTATLLRSWFQIPDGTSTYQLTPHRCFAGAFKGGDHWIYGGMYEAGEGGIFSSATSVVPNKFTGTIADQSSGVGWLITGGTTLDPTSRGNRNSKFINGGYDDILVIGGNSVSIDGATTGGITADVNQPRHGVHHGLHLGGVASFRPIIRVGNRGGGRTGKIVKVEQQGQFAAAAGVDLPGGVLGITTGSVPSLDGWKNALLNYSSPASVSSFTDLVDGVEYTLLANNGNATLQHGSATINLISGTTTTMTAQRPLKFIAFNSVLYQV